MSKLEEIILEHTRLALERANMPLFAATEEEFVAIQRRKVEIMARIEELRKERVKLCQDEKLRSLSNMKGR